MKTFIADVLSVLSEQRPLHVMAGLAPAIHALETQFVRGQGVDARRYGRA
jgi:hypothetical protein